MFLNTSSAFEIVQGVLDLVMTKIGAKFGKDYALRESDDPIFFPKRGAEILLSGKSIGTIGVLHPEVLEKFNLKYPVTCFEARMEDLFNLFKQNS
jgi:phenylalanyl-tRNA synthetase beta chain